MLRFIGLNLLVFLISVPALAEYPSATPTPVPLPSSCAKEAQITNLFRCVCKFNVTEDGTPVAITLIMNGASEFYADSNLSGGACEGIAYSTHVLCSPALQGKLLKGRLLCAQAHTNNGEVVLGNPR